MEEALVYLKSIFIVCLNTVHVSVHCFICCVLAQTSGQKSKQSSLHKKKKSQNTKRPQVLGFAAVVL